MALDGSFALFQPLLHERGDKIGGMMAQLKTFLVFLALHASRAGKSFVNYLRCHIYLR